MPVTNLILEQGATFQRNISLSDTNGMPLNVAGYTANAALKHDPDSSNAYPFEVNLTTGICSLRMEANATALIPEGRYFYDVLMTNGSNTTRIVEGQIAVTPQISE